MFTKTKAIRSLITAFCVEDRILQAIGLTVIVIGIISILHTPLSTFLFFHTGYAFGVGKNTCITYDRLLSKIMVTCKSTSLTAISNALVDARILRQESPKVWLLNANLAVGDNTTLYLNSTDTKWLKVNSTAGVAYFIEIHGSVLSDSVKITSWNTNKNYYGLTNLNGTVPRSYIFVNGNGVARITNSEIAYLGYRHPSSFGLTYYAGAGSILKNNKVHDLWYGFYSQTNRAHNIIIENNEFYYNTLYGIDPHSGTHDIIIKNNKVHDNGRHGIICSTDCFNILIESNRVYNNGHVGIILYNNVSNSVIKNNTSYNNAEDQISIYHSDYNNIYDNNISGGKSGITIINGSKNNNISRNIITNVSDVGINIIMDADNNTVAFNAIREAPKIQDLASGKNLSKDIHVLSR